MSILSATSSSDHRRLLYLGHDFDSASLHILRQSSDGRGLGRSDLLVNYVCESLGHYSGGQRSHEVARGSDPLLHLAFHVLTFLWYESATDHCSCADLY